MTQPNDNLAPRGFKAQTRPSRPPVRLGRLTRAGTVVLRRPSRPLVLALAAAALGLGAAAFGIFKPVPPENTAVAAGDVALVNQEPILMSDFINETEQKEGTSFALTTPVQRARMLRAMIDQELLVQRSLALDLPEQDTDSRTALQDGVIALINAPVVAERPTDEALNAFYQEHRANYATHGSMNLSDLVLHVGGFENADQTVEQALADASQAAYQLRSGVTVEAIKQHFGFVDSGKMNGLEPDFAARLHLGVKLYNVAQAMNDGAVSEPLADTDGVHLLIMYQRQAPVFNDFEAVRNNVYADYLAAEKQKAKDATLKALRQNAQILLAKGQSE